MRTRKARWADFALVTGLGIAGLWAAPARAFDTGHHFDLTRSALQEEGFTGTAVKVAQLQNWLVDYYSSQPTAKLQGDLEKLHFDNLYSTAQINNAWGHLARNAHGAIQDAARQNDKLRALTLLGATLHAVQDFYTHSNWVETHLGTGESYRTETFFDNPPGKDVDLYTGYYPNNPKPAAGRKPHGEYSNGLNHDSYVRPHWDEAYIFAYVASLQWAAALRNWAEEANPGFWAGVQAFSGDTAQDRTDLDRDLNAAYRISQWVALKGAQGHWKGKGSGSLAQFGAFAAAWMVARDSVFVKEFKQRRSYAPLLAGLLGNDALRGGAQISVPEGEPPAIPRAQFDNRAVIVRTTKVEEMPVDFFETKIDTGGKADFYAKISISGQSFVEAMQTDRATVEPMWTSIGFISSDAPIAITYQLWDEDGGLAGGDDHCDIHPAKEKRDVTFQFNPATHQCTGDVSGIHDNQTSAATLEGTKPDKNRARVRFFVTARALQ
jgi:hypothetical protein